jgi:hypothetical protein
LFDIPPGDGLPEGTQIASLSSPVAEPVEP